MRTLWLVLAVVTMSSRALRRVRAGGLVAAICLSSCGGEQVQAGPDADAAAQSDGEASGDSAGDGGSDGNNPGDDAIGRDPPCTSPADCGVSDLPCRPFYCHAQLGCRQTLLADGSVCNDGDPCHAVSACSAGSCVLQAAKDCDDADPCTADTCVAGSCSSTPIPASAAVACDDGQPCTGNDLCDGGSCKGSVNVCLCQTDADCKDKSQGNLCAGTWYCAQQPSGARACVQNPATIVACDGSKDTPCSKNLCAPTTGLCALTTTPDGKGCDDGDPCTAGETCSGGSCGGGTGVCCASDVDCASAEDGNACNGTLFCNKATGVCQLNPTTVVTCPSVDDTACSVATCAPSTGVCAPKAKPDGEICDDGNPCTPGEACKGGSCTATSTNTCPCTLDADCKDKDDGDPCNGVPYCDLKDGSCKTNPATVIVCPTVDDTTCSKNVCDPKKGACAMTPVFDGTACNADGNPCTPNDSCKAGGCVVDAVNTCVCSSNADCAAFDDGDLCNGQLFCDKSKAGDTGQGHCVVNPASIPSCPSVDNTACKQSLCQPKTGSCAMTFVHQGEICDDGVPCTKGDVCENGSCKGGVDICLCKQDSDCLAQEDGNVCNGTLLCDKSALPWQCAVKPSTVITCPSVNDSYCQQSICQPATGLCKLTPLHNDEPCADDDSCTVNTICKGGSCVDPLADSGGKCNDGNPCTDDSCDQVVGCVSKPNQGSCDDGDKCTSGDTCVVGVCKAGKLVSCDDGNACTSELCNVQVGCIVIQNGEACSDGNACTVGDGCKGGACVAGAKQDCADNNPCSLDTCDTTSGACSHDANADPAVVCADGVACTLDSCNPLLGCLHTGNAGACNDAIACTTDTCHAIFGCGHLADASACDDKDACTVDACVLGLGCKHSAAANGGACSDGDACTLGDSCKAGVCVAGAKIPSCNVDPAQCKGKADGTACNDGDACSKGEACAGGVCRPPLVRVEVETIVASDGGNSVDGPLLLARSYAPTGIARLTTGAIAVSSKTPAIRRVDVDGHVRTWVGGHFALSGETFAAGKAGAARFGALGGVAAAANGGLWGVDTGSHVVFRVDAQGEVTLVAGAGTPGHADGKGAAAKFNAPADIALLANGSAVVSDVSNAVLRLVAPDGTVTTYSGQPGTVGGADGSASLATWYQPEGLDVAPDGTVVVADRVGQTVRRRKLDGSVVTIAGAFGVADSADGKGDAARFYGPADVAIAPSGEIFVAEQEGSRLRRIALDGTVTTLVGAAGPGAVDGLAAVAKLTGPSRLTFDAFGDLLVAEITGGALRRVRLRRDACEDGKACTRDDCDAAKGSCVFAAIACDDGSPCTVDACDATQATCSHVATVDGSPCNDADSCSATDICGGGACMAAANVTKASGPQGNDDGPLAKAGFYGVTGLRRGPDGRIAVTETAAHRIRVVSAAGVVTTLAGGMASYGAADGGPTVAQFNGPSGVEWAPDGGIYVADTGNERIRRVSEAGFVSTFAGQGTQGHLDGGVAVARFCAPTDVLLDSQGALLVADLCNNRIRRVASGVVSTWAGGAAGSMRDGVGTNAAFDGPSALALAADGAVLVADTNNGAVRRISPAGVVTTLIGDRRNTQAQGVGLAASIVTPMGVAVGPDGTVWVAAASGRVGIIDSDGRLRLAAGGAAVDGLDGVGAGAGLGQLRKIAVMADGRALVADANIDMLRWLSPPVLACDDANPCTADTCQPKVGCVHVQLGSPCDDGNPCTAGDVCAAGACKAGTAVSGCVCKPGAGQGCDDANPCTVDTCDAKLGCKHAPLAGGVACDDGNACTSKTRCDGGTCAPPPEAAVSDAGGATVDGAYGSNRDGVTTRHEGVAVAGVLGPYDLAVQGEAIVFVEADGHDVRRLRADGVLETVAGGLGYGYGHRDGSVTTARFLAPRGVAIGNQGEIVVADAGNHVLRQIATGAVSTVAGAPGKIGLVDGKGAVARFTAPAGLGRDASGLVLVADAGNHAIRRLGVGGTVTTVAGDGTAGLVDGPASKARFHTPADVAGDSKGAIWVADQGNAAIRRIDANGAVVTLLRSGSSATPLAGVGFQGTQISTLAAIDVGPAGVVFTDVGLGVARLLRADSATVELLGGGGKANGGPGAASSLLYAAGIVALADGSWVVSQSGHHRLRRLRPIASTCDDGNACTIDVCDKQKGCSHTPADPAKVCGDGTPCQQPTCDVSVGRCSFVALANGSSCGAKGDCASQCLRGQCVGVGALTESIGSGAGATTDGPPGVGSLLTPVDACTGPDGKLWIVEQTSGAIRRVDAGGALATVAGGIAGYAEGKGAAAKMLYPSGLASDGSAVYVADTGNHRIRKVDVAGNVITVAGDGTAGDKDGPGQAGRVNSPNDVAASAGVVWIADSANHTIRNLASGKLTTAAGIAGSGGFVDGPLGTNQLYWPNGVAIDGKGTLWICDGSNGALRRLGADGVVTTVAGDAIFTSAGPVDGRGRRGASWSTVRSLLPLADGTIVTLNLGDQALRRTWPGDVTRTIVGLPGTTGLVDGAGAFARLGGEGALAADASGAIWFADRDNHRVRRLRLDLQSCADLTGSSPQTAAKSCKAAAKALAGNGLGDVWIDPDPTDKLPAFRTRCNTTSAGGGWTLVTADVEAAQVDKLLGGKGQVLYTCSQTASDGVVSPTFTQPWSWLSKQALAGSWTVLGKSVTCGADASFASLSCGWGVGCASADGPTLLPGVASASECGGPGTIAAAGAMAICGATLHTDWQVYVRAAD